jgi:hypothetical protein
VVEQVTGRSHQQRERPFGEEPGFGDQLDDPVGDHRGAGGGLGQHGHPGEKRDGGLADHPPGREVERVDVNRHAVPRRTHVLCSHFPGANQVLLLAIDEHLSISEALGQVGVGRQHPHRAVDVELGITARVATVLGGEVEQLFACGVDRLLHLLEQRTALGKGQSTQVLAPDLPGPGHRLGQ